MGLDKLEAPKRTARVASYVVEIQKARARGVTWGQIVREVGPAVGIDPSTAGAEDRLRAAVKAAQKQIEQGKLKPVAVGRVGHGAGQSPGERSAPYARSGFQHIPLPGDGDEQTAVDRIVNKNLIK